MATTAERGHVRVAIYKSKSNPPEYHATCDCGWAHPRSESSMAAFNAAEEHLVGYGAVPGCNGAPEIKG